MARGVLVQRRVTRIMQSRLGLYKSQIFYLWRHTHTPLCYRAKFWQLLLASNISFVLIAVAEEELVRLWHLLDLKLTEVPECGEDVFGINLYNEKYRTCEQVSSEQLADL